MLLSNISVVEEGQKHILGEEKTKGAILENLIGMFSYFKKNPIFDFVANIMSNVSALQAGRDYMLENKNL